MTEVRSWTECDIPGLCGDALVFGFDLDGTLASSRQPMAPAMVSRFSALTNRVTVALISGGGMDVVTSQVLDVLDESADRSRLHVMPTSGSRYYRWNGMSWSLVYAHDFDTAETAHIVDVMERRAHELGLWPDHAWGALIENRGSQITFSALGQQAPVAIKEQWDRDGAKKRALVEALRRDLPRLAVRAGGLTSVDVSKQGLDKAFAVRTLAETLQIDVGSMVFVGDRMTPDGNDYPAVEAGAIGLRVRDPEDALGLMDSLLACL